MMPDRAVQPRDGTPMLSTWQPRDIIQLIVITTGCLCLMIVVLGSMVGIGLGYVTVELLGSIQGVGAGGGVLGIAMIVYQVIKVGLGGAKKDD